MRQFHSSLHRFTVLVVSSFLIGLGGCTSSLPDRSAENESPSESVNGSSLTPDSASKFQIVTTFLPVTLFTKAVAGDRADVVQLLPLNVGPHDFQARPEDAEAIATADVLVQNGLGIEFFLQDLIENTGNSGLVIIDSSEGIETLDIDEGVEEDHKDHEHPHGHHEDEDHAHEAHKHEDHAHEDHAHEAHKHEDHAHEDHAHGHHHHGDIDPHIWLDPKRAIEQVENIRDGLIAVDPSGKAEYTANAADYIEQLQTLDAEIVARLAPYAGQTFITFHDFAFYFAASYDLEAVHLVDIPKEAPSPADVRRIIETTETANLKALLSEPQVGERGFEAWAEDLNVEISVFDPLETGTPEPDYYFTTMDQNVENLEQALGN